MDHGHIRRGGIFSVVPRTKKVICDLLLALHCLNPYVSAVENCVRCLLYTLVNTAERNVVGVTKPLPGMFAQQKPIFSAAPDNSLPTAPAGTTPAAADQAPVAPGRRLRGSCDFCTKRKRKCDGDGTNRCRYEVLMRLMCLTSSDSVETSENLRD